MTNNTIALEVKKARLANILIQIDQYLGSCGEIPEHIARLYGNFITENQITREVPDELKKVLPPGYTSPSIAADEASTNPPTQTSVSSHSQHNRKPKSNKRHPKAIKSPEQELFQSPPNPPQPP